MGTLASLLKAAVSEFLMCLCGDMVYWFMSLALIS